LLPALRSQTVVTLLQLDGQPRDAIPALAKVPNTLFDATLRNNGACESQKASHVLGRVGAQFPCELDGHLENLFCVFVPTFVECPLAWSGRG